MSSNFGDKLKSVNQSIGKFFGDVKSDQKTRTLFIIIVCVIILGGALLALLLTGGDGGQGAEASSQEASSSGVEKLAITLINRAPKDVASLYIENTNCKVTIQKKDDSYQLVEYPDVPLSEEYIAYSWEYSYYFGADQEVQPDSNTDVDATYGFTSPQASFTTTFTDGKQATVEVGAAVPGQNGKYYIRMQGKPNIYVSTVHGSVFYALPEFVSRVVQGTPKHAGTNSYKTVSVDHVNIEGNGLASPVKVSKNPQVSVATADTFAYSYIVTMQDGTVYGADDDYASALMYQLLDITANKVAAVHPTQKQLASFGLASPKGVISYDYTVEDDNKTEARTIKVGNITEQFTYIMYDGVNVVYKIETNQLYHSLAPNLVDMRTEYVITRQFSSIKAMTVSFDGKDYRFELNRSSQSDENSSSFYTYQAVYNGKELDLENYQKYFLTFVSMKAVSYDAKISAGAVPALTVKVEYFSEVGKQEETITLTASESVRQYLCQINGKGDMSVSESFVTRLKANTENLVNGKSIVEY